MCHYSTHIGLFLFTNYSMKGNKESAIIQKSHLSWSLITGYGYIELWKTPCKFLVCYQYEGIYKFFDHFDDAKHYMIELGDEMNHIKK